MNFTFFKRERSFPLLGIVISFIVSRILYDRAGIIFQGNLYLGWWHYIDPALLLSDLWRSVFYLHSQPPLMNLFLGIVLQAFPNNYESIFHIIYFLLGLIFSAGIYALGINMGFKPWLSAILTTWFMTSPGTVLYEHFIGYGYPIAVLLVWAGIFLYRFSISDQTIWGVLFFSSLAIIALLWAFFHIIWLLGIFIFMFIFIPHRKKIILAACLPILLVAGWYVKNLFEVGQFTASSWAGMNLAKIVTFRTPEADRKKMVKSGELSKFALIPPFRNPIVYLKLLPNTPLTGIPILDEVETSIGTRNFHHLVFAEASENYLRDALHLILVRPQYYLRSIGQAFYIYFHSPSDFDPVIENRERIRTLDTWWNRLFYGQWESDETSIDRNVSMKAQSVGWLILIVFFADIYGGIQFLSNKRNELRNSENLLIFFMIFNIMFVTVVGNLMDIGENNRFRYVIDPFLMLLFVFFLRNAFLTHQSRS